MWEAKRLVASRITDRGSLDSVQWTVRHTKDWGYFVARVQCLRFFCCTGSLRQSAVCQGHERINTSPPNFEFSFPLCYIFVDNFLLLLFNKRITENVYRLGHIYVFLCTVLVRLMKYMYIYFCYYCDSRNTKTRRETEVGFHIFCYHR